jgi:hypothetical protein
MKNQRGITKWNTFSVAVLNTSKAQDHAVVKLNTCASYSRINFITLKKKQNFCFKPAFTLMLFSHLLSNANTSAIML